MRPTPPNSAAASVTLVFLVRGMSPLVDQLLPNEFLQLLRQRLGAPRRPSQGRGLLSVHASERIVGTSEGSLQVGLAKTPELPQLCVAIVVQNRAVSRHHKPVVRRPKRVRVDPQKEPSLRAHTDMPLDVRRPDMRIVNPDHMPRQKHLEHRVWSRLG